MSDYTFRQDETIAEGVHRLFLTMVDTARAHLSGHGEDSVVEAVHEARKELKKARALVRLVRDDLPGYDDANRLCRDAGRAVSHLRDATAQIETVDMLRAQLGEGVADESLDRLRAVLVERRDTLHEGDDQGPISDALAILNRANEFATALDVSKVDVDSLVDGLARSYGRGRDEYRDCRKKLDTEALHEWRKRTKYHRYHIRFLQPAWPGPMEAWEDALHDLTDFLGDDHDLAVLRGTLTGMVKDEPDLAEDAATLIALGDRVRATLQESALDAGARCFVEKPKDMAKRVVAYVEAWHAEREHLPQGLAPIGATEAAE